jgi:hypothetical protein
MTWTRNHIPGKDAENYKEWRAGRGRYRVTWRSKVEGVSVTPGYRACYQIFSPCLRRPVWEFIDTMKKPVHRTLKAAKIACEKHADPKYRPPRKKRRSRKK